MTKLRRSAATALVVAALTSSTLTGCGKAPATAEQPSESTISIAPSTEPDGSSPSAGPAAPESVGTTAAELPSIATPAPLPARLTVPKADLDMPIQAVGVGSDGQMALPPRPTTIGWYRFGPSPGDAVGSVVLGGHLDSRQYGVGPLVRLRRLQPDDPIEVTMAGGAVVRYRVSAVKDIPKRKLAVDELFDRAGPPRLQLITCGGPYDPNAGGYRDNLVVTAVAIS